MLERPEPGSLIANLETELRTIRESTQTAAGRPPPALLYHYCSAESFTAILASRTLRAGDLRHMNDPDEIAFGRRRIAQAAGDDAIVLKTGFAAEKMSGSIYVACASEEPDSLPQWRGYAREGLGYALGIPSDAQFVVRNQGVQPDWAASVALRRVVYDEEEQDELVRSACSKINLIHESYFERATSPEERREIDLRRLVALGGCFSELSSIFKNKAFRYEVEWRWVFEPIGGAFLPGRAVRYRASAFGLTPYVELAAEPPEALLPLRQVVTGPKIPAPEGVLIASNFLLSLGYVIPRFTQDGDPPPVEVCATKAAYR